MCDKQSDNLEEESSESLMHEDPPTMSNGVSNQQSSIDYNFSCQPVTNNSLTQYRVIQVGSDTNQQQTLSIVPVNSLNIQAGTSPSAPQVAFVTNSLNSGDGDSSGAQSSGNSSESQSKYATYFPSVSSGNDLGSSNDNQDHTNVTGQFYVMMSSPDMLQTNSARTIVSRKVNSERGNAIVRDTNRRTQHNEVERRRRDKINTWIMKLSKLVPDCQGDNTKQGQSKGGILAKACEYIADIKQQNQHLVESNAKCDRIQVDYEVLRLELEEKKQENLILRQTLQSHGIEVKITNTNAGNSH